jgi:hypothetical protein
MPTRVERTSLSTTVVRVDDPTVSIPSHPVRRIELPMTAASTPRDQIPPSFVPLFVDVFVMSSIRLSSASACEAAAGRPKAVWTS